MNRLLHRLMLVLTLILSCQFAFSQTRPISGKITDTNGEALIGASVAVKGTLIGLAAAELNTTVGTTATRTNTTVAETAVARRSRLSRHSRPVPLVHEASAGANAQEHGRRASVADRIDTCSSCCCATARGEQY